MRFRLCFLLLWVMLSTVVILADVEPRRAVDPVRLPSTVLMLANDAVFGTTATNLYDLDTAAEKDSTSYYRVSKYMSIQVIIVNATQDSFKWVCNIYATNDTSGMGAEPVYFDALLDSIVVTSHLQVDNLPITIEVPPCEFFWVQVVGATACGINQQFKLALTRND